MTITDFQRENGRYFVAMQYYSLILNRTYLVLLTDSFMIGIQSNGLVSIKGGGDAFTMAVTEKLAVSGDLNNPLSYVNPNYIKRIENIDLLSDDLLTKNKSNFRISYSDILTVKYDARKKWGMGYYPHDGKVYVKTNSGKTIEFIILGSQSGQSIRDLIAAKIPPMATVV